jgi:hypothetical protein
VLIQPQVCLRVGFEPTTRRIVGIGRTSELLLLGFTAVTRSVAAAVRAAEREGGGQERSGGGGDGGCGRQL